MHTKLNERQVCVIRQLASEGYSPRELATVLRVSQSTIRAVVRGKTWAWVPNGDDEHEQTA